MNTRNKLLLLLASLVLMLVHAAPVSAEQVLRVREVNCKWTLISVNGESATPKLECDLEYYWEDVGFDTGAGNTGSPGGGGSAADAQEQARKARCEQAKTEYTSNNCSSRDLNPPAHDSAIRFSIVPISSQAQYNYFRPIIREFHTQIFNDASGNAINNFSSVLTQLRDACDANNTVLAGICKIDANSYFGQPFFGGGLQNFLDSAAGTDAKPNVKGSVCQEIRARHAADQCGAWPG
jgi:hypothetical protein